MKTLATILVEQRQPLVIDEVELPALRYGHELVEIKSTRNCGWQLGALCCLRLPDGHERDPRITHTVTEDRRWGFCPRDDIFPPFSSDEMARNSI